jgi:hypothetical protein
VICAYHYVICLGSSNEEEQYVGVLHASAYILNITTRVSCLFVDKVCLQTSCSGQYLSERRYEVHTQSKMQILM